MNFRHFYLSPFPTNASTAQPLYIPIDYRVIRQFLVPKLAEIGFPLLPVDAAVLAIINPMTGNKPEQRQVFELFFDRRKVRWSDNAVAGVDGKPVIPKVTWRLMCFY